MARSVALGALIAIAAIRNAQATAVLTIAANAPLGTAAVNFTVTFSGITSAVSTDWIGMYCNGVGGGASNGGTGYYSWAYIPAASVTTGAGTLIINQAYEKCNLIAYYYRDPSPYTLLATSNIVAWTTPTPTGSHTPTGTSTPTPTPSSTTTATATVTTTPTTTSTSSITPVPTVSSTPSSSASSSASGTMTSGGSSSSTASSSKTATSTRTPTASASATASESTTATQTASNTPSQSSTVTSTPSSTPSPSSTASSSRTATVTATASKTASVTPSSTSTPSSTRTGSQTASITLTPSATPGVLTAAAQAPLGPGAVPFMISFTNVAGVVSSDWIAFYCTGAGVNSYLNWTYVTSAANLDYVAGSGSFQLWQSYSSCSMTVQYWRDPSPYTLILTSNVIPWTTPTPTGSLTPSHTSSLTATATRSSTGSQTATPSASVSITQSASPSLSTGASPSTTASPSGTPSATLTSTATPSITPTATLSGSNTGTPSKTPSATQTPSNSPTPSRRVDKFEASSVLVLRIGDAQNDATATAVGVMLPLYVDEYDPTGIYAPAGQPVTSTAVPTNGTAACTLAVGQVAVQPYGPFFDHDREGFPQVSQDGTLVTWPCYRVQAGYQVADSASTTKALATVNAHGDIDSSTTTVYPFGGTSSGSTALRTSATVNGAQFWYSGAPAFVPAGNLFSGGWLEASVGTYSTTTANLVLPYYSGGPGSYSVRGVGVYGNQLYGTASYAAGDTYNSIVFTIGSGLPTTQTQNVGSTTTLPGFASLTSLSPWNFVFQNASALWLADDSNLASWNLLRFQKAGGSWAQTSAVSLSTSPIYTFGGRLEAQGYVLYATTTLTLYSYVVNTRVKTVLANAPPYGYFKGVTIAPVNTAWLPASPFITTSPTATLSSSPTFSATASLSSTGSATASVSVTQSASASISVGASPSFTPSGTGSPSQTGTATGTPSATPSQTGTRTRTHTPSQTSSQTSTTSSTGTGTPTGTGSPSQTGTQTPTPTASLTFGATNSNTATATVTPSQTRIIDVYYATNVLVVRVGDATTASAGVGVAQPVYIDEYDATLTNRVPASSLAMPTSACTLATGSATSAPWGWYDTDGFPSISDNGLLMTFGCYGSVLGSRIPDSQSTTKTIAIIDSLGHVDTATKTGGYPYGGSSATSLAAFHSVITLDGTSFFYTGTPGYQAHLAYQGGYGRVTRGGAATTWISPLEVVNSCPTGSICPDYSPGCYDARSMSIYNGVLYGTDQSASGDVVGGMIFSFTQTAQGVFPSALAYTNTLPGFYSTLAVTTQPWTMVWENANSFYFADTSNTTGAHVRHYVFYQGQWLLSNNILFPNAVGRPVYSIAGRNASAAAGGGFIIYATVPNALMTWASASNSYSVVATPVAGVFRGVALAPDNYAWIQASATGTPTSTQTGTQSPTGTQTGTGTGTGTPTCTGSPSGTASSSASQSAGATPTGTSSITPSGSQTASSSHTATQTATNTASASVTASLTASQTATATLSVTPTRTFEVDTYAASSLLVVRLGDGSNNAGTAATGAALPVYLDEYDSTQAPSPLLSTVALPPSACTLARGKATTGSPAYAWYETEGLPSLSTDARLFVLPCHSGVSLGASIVPSASSVNTIVSVRADGTLDTSTTTNLGYGGTSATYLSALRTAVTVNGSFYYVTAGPGSAATGGGFVLLSPGVYTSAAAARLLTSGSTAAGYHDARSLTLNGGALFGADSALDSAWAGLFSIGASYPTTTVTATVLNGANTYTSPWSFVFQSVSQVYVADDSSSSTFNVLYYKRNGANTWVLQTTIAINATSPIYSLAGRNESSGFALYATSLTVLYRYDVTAAATSVVATAASGTVFRGVASAPYVASWLAETPSGSPASTSSPSSSKTGTPTKSSTHTSTRSGSSTPTKTGTLTPSISASASQTSSVSASASSSGTASISGASTALATASNTRTNTKTATSTRSSSPVPTTTPSSSVSAVPTSSASPSSTGSSASTSTSTETSSASSSASGSGSVSYTAVSTPTRSHTPPVSASATHTATRSKSGTATQTPSTSSTSSGSNTGSVSTTGTPTASPSSPPTPPNTATSTTSPTPSKPASHSPSLTPSRSLTASKTGSAPATHTVTPSRTVSTSRSASKTHTPTRSPTPTRSSTRSPTRTHTGTSTVSRTKSGTRKAK